MKKSETQWLTRIGVILQFLLGSSFALGQVVGETKTIDITVDDQHPMEAAIVKIEELSGVPINYEDVPIYYAADLKDVTKDVSEEVLRKRVSNEPILTVRGGRLSVSIVVDAATGRLNDIRAVNAALTALVSAYNSSDLPGAFEVEQYKGVFFVKPVRYRDATGATRPMTPVLSTPITLPEEKRDRSETIRLILDQLSKAVGSTVGLGTNLGQINEETIGAKDEPAHYLFARYLAAMACHNTAREGCEPVIAQSTWDVGMHYRLSYGLGWGYLLGVFRVPNSRWWVPPTPSKPYSPPPSPQPQVGFPRIR